MKDNLRVIDFKPWHMKLIKPGRHYECVNLDKETFAYLNRCTNGITVLIDDKIAAIIGIVELWNGVGELTMIPTDVYYEHLKECYTFSKSMISKVFDLFPYLHRVQATAMATNSRHNRFLTKLGFVFEGELVGYGPSGENLNIYRLERE